MTAAEDYQLKRHISFAPIQKGAIAIKRDNDHLIHQFRKLGNHQSNIIVRYNVSGVRSVQSLSKQHIRN